MDMDNMKKLQIDLRKYQSSMALSGIAIIAFGIWTFIKSGLIMLMTHSGIGSRAQWSEIANILRDENTAVTVVTASIAIIIVVGVLALDLGIRFKVGLSARREGHGGEKMGKGTIVLAVILALMLVVSTIAGINELMNKKLEEGLNTRVAAVLIDITALATSINLFFAMVKVRKLKKMIGEENKPEDDITLM